MQIIHITPNLEKGGPTISILQTLLLADRSRNKMAVIYGKSKDEDSSLQLQARLEGIEFIRISSLGTGFNPIRDILSIRKICAHLKLRHVDILHTHGLKGFVIGSIVSALAGTRSICHTLYGQITNEKSSKPAKLLYFLVQRLSGSLQRNYIVLSESEKQATIQGKYAEPDSIHLIRGGVDLSKAGSINRADARTRLNIRDNTFVICSTARFVPEKNHDTLLEVARILRSARIPFLWMFLGDGEHFQSFRRTAQMSGLIEKFFFAGWVDDVHSYLPACDAFCLLPHSEPLGRAFIEAQAEGIPVVGSKIGVIPEIVLHRKTGFLHSFDDPNGVAGSIKRLFDEPALRRSAAENAKLHISTSFSIENMVKSIERLYETIHNQ